MTQDQKIYVIAGAAGLIALAAYVGLLLVPVWKSYSRIWQRIAATFLSFYVLAACLALGLVGAAGVVWLWGNVG
jgi:hypothetical protein